MSYFCVYLSEGNAHFPRSYLVMWLFTLLNDWGLYLRYGFHVPQGVWVATFIRRDRGCLYSFYTERTCSLDSFLDLCYFTALNGLGVHLSYGFCVSQGVV